MDFTTLDSLSLSYKEDALVQSDVKLVDLQAWLLNRIQANDSDIDIAWALETMRRVAESRISASKR